MWDFLREPESVVKDTNMIFEGVHDEYERACIIEYLVYLKRGGLNQEINGANKLSNYLEKNCTIGKYKNLYV